MAVIDLKHTTIEIRDGTSVTPLTLEIRIGEGNLTYSERRNIEYRRDRGSLGTVREGDEEPMEVGLDFEWEFLRSDGAEPITPEEALKRTGAAAAWVSSSADPCEPYAVDLVITYSPPCSDAKDEVIVLEDFRWESMDHNLRDSQVSVKGQCNATEALITRVASAMARYNDMPPQERQLAMADEREKELRQRQERERELYERVHQQSQSQEREPETANA